MKVLNIFGTRPEAIKLAPVIRELQKHPSEAVCLVCVTAQHREMLDQVLKLFQIIPDYDLDVMQDNQSPTQIAAAVLARLEPILQAERPDWVLVQGDTTTVAAASLAAFYAGVKVGHVEAGLRTHNKRQPFPEEINRRVAGAIADLHFAPTERGKQNLLLENVPNDSIIVTGNTVIDALHWVVNLPFDFASSPLASIPLERRIVLVTAHRRESFGEPLLNICHALLELAACYPTDVQIVYPVHLNPNVHEPVYRLLRDVPNISLLPPLNYLPFVHLLKHSYLVLTDSGGIQEEAPGLGRPVLVLRDITERPEAVEAGTVRIVGTQKDRILDQAMQLLDDAAIYEQMAKTVNPYGDGRSAQRIVQVLTSGSWCRGQK